MYQPTTRLLTVLELLQARGTLSGAELSKRLEVDRRSIRRYITMLQDLGIPIEGMRGPAGGYRLRPGYKLPPLMFTDQEAVALTLALLAAPRLGLAVDPVAMAGALAKLERVLPIAARERVHSVQRVIALGPPPTTSEASSELVTLLSHASRLERQVRIAYRNRSGGDTERAIDPYGVVNLGQRWYVAAYCHLRDEERTFRIDRISAAVMLEDAFQMPAGVDPLAMLLTAIAGMPGTYQVEVLLETTIERAKRQVSPPYGQVEEAPEGVLFRCRVDELDPLARYLVGLGVRFTVLQPVELKQAIGRLAEELAGVARG